MSTGDSPRSHEGGEDASSVAIEVLLEQLASTAALTANSRSIDVRTIVENICTHANRHGLEPTALETITDIVTTKNHLDQASCSALLKHLFPSSFVPSECILTAVGALGSSKLKAKLATQTLLVRWMYNTYAYIEDRSILSRLYGVLFDLLDMHSLRPVLCTLLALITRRKHVRVYRIQRIITLLHNLGSDPGLLTLLRAYQTYYPDVILEKLGSGRVASFVKADAEWRSKLLRIRNGRTVTGHNFSSIANLPHVHTAKRRQLLQPIRSLRNSESSVALEDISSVEELVGNLELIDAPSQISPALEQPLLRKFLTLKMDENARRRLQFWLTSFSDEILEHLKDGGGQSAFISEALEILLGYTQSLKRMTSGLRDLLTTFVTYWNGLTDAHVVLQLLSYLPMAEGFDDLHRDVLRLAETVLVANNPESLQLLSGLYADTLRNWTVAQENTEPSYQRLDGVILLCEHVATLHLSSLVSSGSPAICSTILQYYQQLSALQKLPQRAASKLILPTNSVVALLTFSSSIDNVSRLCGVLSQYKELMELNLSKHISIPQDTTDRFNGYVLDIVDLFWRSRALSVDSRTLADVSQEPLLTALRSYLNDIDREYNLASIFGLAHNPLLSSISLQSLQELEREASVDNGHELQQHIGPVTQHSLAALGKEGGLSIGWKQYRVAMLVSLEGKGLSGIKDLMYVTMRDLRNEQTR